MKYTTLILIGVLTFVPFPATARDEAKPSTATAADRDNPGMPWLDQAIEEKLKASGPQDFDRVIALALRAKKEGLSGENLQFCEEFIASEKLQYGLVMGQQIADKPPNRLPRGWNALRIKVLDYLEDAVKVIKDQPSAYIRIAQLNLLPDGDVDRAGEALKLAEEHGKNDPSVFAQVTLIRAMLEKDPDKREELIARATERHPDTRLRMMHAMSLVDLDRRDDALVVLQTILESEPDNISALEAALEILANSEKFEEALRVLDALQEKAPDDRLLLHRARILANLGRNVEAVELLDELRRKHPDDAAIPAIRAAIHVDLKEYDKALRDIDAALRIVPGHPTFMILKMEVLVLLGRYDAAESQFDDIRTEHPDDDEPVVRFVQSLVATEQYERAGAVLDKLRKEQPDKEQWALLAVQLFVSQKKFNEAEALIESLRKEKPDESQWPILLARIYVDKKQFDKAAGLLEKLHAENPDREDWTILLIQVLSDGKKNRKALEYLEPLVKQNPDNLDLLRLKSQLLISSNRHTEAARTLEVVVQAAPDDEVSLNNLSWLLSTSPIDMLRNGKRALELAEKACELTDYKKSYILSTLAAAYAELGDFDKAVEWSRKSLDLAEGDENVRDRIDELRKELESYQNKQPFRESNNESDD